MRVRLLSSHGSGPNWQGDSHADTVAWARRLEAYGVKWREVCLPIYIDTLNKIDPIFEQRDSNESCVVIDEAPLLGLSEFVSDFDVTLTLLPTERWVWVEDGDPVTHSLCLNDEAA